jgi:hypothetical protein
MMDKKPMALQQCLGQKALQQNSMHRHLWKKNWIFQKDRNR